MTNHLHRIHGLTLRSEVPLTAPPAPSGSPVDVQIRRHRPRPVPTTPPTGQVVVARTVGGVRWYTGVRRGAGYLLRFHAVLDVALDPAQGRIDCRRDPDADEGLAEILLSGAALAFHLIATGSCVLHASAVEADGSAIAFVGLSGAGKTTTAALACAAGARCLTDDVLRVDLDDEATRVHPGGPTLRLRPLAQDVARLLCPGSVPLTADGRFAVQPTSATTRQPLRCIVLVQPDRVAADVLVEPIPRVAAVPALAQALRLTGWQDPHLLSQQFRQHARLARTVPVVTARIPWGPPFESRHGRALLDALADRPLRVG